MGHVVKKFVEAGQVIIPLKILKKKFQNVLTKNVVCPLWAVLVVATGTGSNGSFHWSFKCLALCHFEWSIHF